MSFEVPNPLRFDPLEDSRIINPSSGKKYRWDKVELINDEKSFMEITYNIIVNPRKKTGYTKKAVLYLGKSSV